MISKVFKNSSKPKFLKFMVKIFDFSYVYYYSSGFFFDLSINNE